MDTAGKGSKVVDATGKESEVMGAVGRGSEVVGAASRGSGRGRVYGRVSLRCIVVAIVRVCAGGFVCIFSCCNSTCVCGEVLLLRA